MKKTTTTLALLFITSFTFSVAAQTTGGKTFTKSFNTDGKGILRLELPEAADLKIWDNPSIRFEITISLPNGNTAILNELSNIGRYNLVSESVGDALVITAPNLQKRLKVKGEELKEAINFIVFIPKDMEVEIMPATVVLADIKK